MNPLATFDERADAFSKQLTIGVMRQIDRQYKLELRSEDDVVGSAGELYDRTTRSRYFQMEFIANSSEMDLFNRTDVLAEFYVDQAAREFKTGLREVGARPGDMLFVWASPKRPVVRVTPSAIGTVDVSMRLVVALPHRLPSGMKEGVAQK